MPRPKRADKPVGKLVYLPQHLVDTIDLLHMDAVTMKPRYGALSSYIERLIREDFHRRGIQVVRAPVEETPK